MAQEQNISTRQSQQMVMTPHMQQSIKILQLNQLELLQYISEQIELNPLLEVEELAAQSEDSLQQESSEEYSADNNEDASIQELTELDWQKNSTAIADKEPAERNDYATSEAYFPSSSAGSYVNIEENHASTQSLYEYILDQAMLAFSEAQDLLIARHLIDYLDESGYIKENYLEIRTKLGCKKADIERVLDQLQTLEPSGIFARNLSECLIIQLKDINRFDPIIAKLIDHLELLANFDLLQLKNICKVTSAELDQMIKDIRRLNPKPASNFVHDVTEHRIPDVFLHQQKGEWVVEINQEVLPKILINQSYVQSIKEHRLTDEEEEYMSTQLSNANWLIRTLDQRAKTILAITTEVVSRQKDFFEKGIYHLKPMNLHEVATALDLHASTISRTTNKTILTPSGTFELKYFFSSAASKQTSSDQQNVTATTVKHRIKEILSQETIEHIFSDEEIVTLLDQEGMALSRRTVAKYREALHIPSSSKRRKQKKMQG